VQLPPGTNLEVERLLREGWNREFGGKPIDAETSYKEAVALAETLPVDTDEKRELPRALSWLAQYYSRHANWDAARQAGERSLHLHEERFGADDPLVAQGHLLLGSFAVKSRQFDQAEPELRPVLETYWRIPKAVGEITAAVAAQQLAAALRGQDRSADAIGVQLQAIVILGRIQPPDEERRAIAWRYLGWLYDDLNRWKEAGAARDEAVAAAERLQAPLEDTLPAMLVEQAKWNRQYGNLALARTAAEKAVALRTSARGPYDPATSEARLVLAHILIQQGDRARADPEYAAVLDNYRRYPNEQAARWAGVAGCELGRSKRIQKRPAEAVPPLLVGVAARESALPDEIAELAECMRILGFADLDLRKLGEAEPAFRKSIALYDKAGKGDEADVGHVHSGLGDTLFELGRYREAEEAQRRAATLSRRAATRSPSRSPRRGWSPNCATCAGWTKRRRWPARSSRCARRG
jgi:tetratricopeptide (TPR) repeat protein